MAAKSINLKAIRAQRDAQVPPRLGLRIVAIFILLEALLLLICALVFPGTAGAANIKGDVSVNTSAGYARLVFKFAEEPDSDVRLANGIVIITFKKPVDVSVDRISIGAADYISAARRDPDGTAIRLALARKVTVNSMTAGEQLFVDLLPDGWTGLPPGLPQDVVDELVRRARDAETTFRQQQQLARQRALAPLRVRVGTQPTFTRYVFELPDLTSVTTDRDKDGLTLQFEAPLKFDFADAWAALPATVASIQTKVGDDKASVRFAFAGKVDVRTFREDNNYIVDVSGPHDDAPHGDAAAMTVKPPVLPTVAAPVPVPPTRPAVALPTKRGRDRPAAPPAVAAPAAPPPAEAKVEGEKIAPPADIPKPEPAIEITEAPPDRPAQPAGIVASKGAFDPDPAKATPQPTEPAEEPVRPTSADASEPITVEIKRQGDTLRLVFPFVAPTSAAVFRRADTLWLVFDAAAPVDIRKLIAQPIASIRAATVARSRDGQVVRIKLDRPKLTSLALDGSAWIVSIADLVLEPTQPLAVGRAIAAPGHASAVIPFQAPQQVHRIADPEIGDTLLVVTAFGPPRGFLRTQNFVEFRALASTHGVAIQPFADDLTVDSVSDKIVIGRPTGLTLSSASLRLGPSGQISDLADATGRPAEVRPFVFDAQIWGFDRQADFTARQSELIRVAAAAPDSKLTAARLDLARFYFARDLYPEAKGVLDLVASEPDLGAAQLVVAVLRAAANVMLGRAAEALKDLASPTIGDQYDAPIWRALAHAHEGRWVEARAGFRTIGASSADLPIELQQIVYMAALRGAIEVGDFADAANQLHQFETFGVPSQREPEMNVLRGRLAEGLGRIADALSRYHTAAASSDRQAAARGRLREIVLRWTLGRLKRAEIIADLENLTTVWRGDGTEVEALELLGRLYTEDGRYRDALRVMRVALIGHPRSDVTRRIQDQAAATFEVLFLGGKADAMPVVDALSLFYDFRELTPVGRRGDEMIRRLADRLVSVDLLDQAAELLQHQVDHRLEGAARAQIAIRLAIIYLMSHKPDRAIQALRATRTAELPNALRTQRLLLEARALSDTGRYDLALEVVSNIEGREAERLRIDVLWTARRWREAAEQIERLYGERWRDFAPLTGFERADILRAAIGYALAEDTFGLDRFRQKYAAKMADGPDPRAFEVVTSRPGAGTTEFAEIAKAVSAIDTLDGFLREIRAKFADPDPAMPAPTPVPQTDAPRSEKSS